MRKVTRVMKKAVLLRQLGWAPWVWAHVYLVTVLALTCGEEHAGKVAPAPPQPVYGELAHKDGGHLGEGQEGKVEEDAARQIHRIQLRVHSPIIDGQKRP